MKGSADHDLRLLRCFVGVAQALSFRAAAEQLHVAQPWLSQSIARLEKLWGVVLFDRSTRHVRLTEDGQTLLPKARRLVEEAHELAAAVRLCQEMDSVPALKLGTAHFLSGLPQRVRLVDALLRTEAISLQICSGDQTQLLHKVRRGLLDAALIAGDLGGEFEFLPLLCCGLEVVMPADLPEAQGTDIDREALTRLPLGLWRLPETTFSPALLQELDANCRQRTRLPDDDVAGSLAFASQRGLVLPLPAMLLDTVQLPQGYVRRPVCGADELIQIGLARRRTSRTHAAVRMLWQVATGLGRGD